MPLMQTVFTPSEFYLNIIKGACATIGCTRTRIRRQRYCIVCKPKKIAEAKRLVAEERRKRAAAANFGDRPCTTVYFVQAGQNGPVKIGVTENIRNRMSGLQVSSPIKLELLATIYAPSELEGRLHHALAEHHTSGEWFNWCPEIEMLVALAREGKVENIVHFAMS